VRSEKDELSIILFTVNFLVAIITRHIQMTGKVFREAPLGAPNSNEGHDDTSTSAIESAQHDINPLLRWPGLAWRDGGWGAC